MTAPAFILLFFFTFATPRGDFAMYYRVLLGVSFTSAGMGHALVEQSIITQPGSIGIYFNLLFALLAGFSPPKSELPDGATNASYLSFAYEAIVKGEYHAYPDVLALSAQLVLANTLQICDLRDDLPTDALPMVMDCPLDCDYYCVQALVWKCVAWGFCFRMLVVLAQLFQIDVSAEECYKFNCTTTEVDKIKTKEEKVKEVQKQIGESKTAEFKPMVHEVPGVVYNEMNDMSSQY